MSLAMSPSLNRATFALQSRLFVAMKRAGRVIDLVWFQQNPEYAGAVLDTCARMADQEVRSLGETLRPLLGEYLQQSPARATVLPLHPSAPVLEPAPALPAGNPGPSVEALEPAELDRHLTSLR